MIINQENQQAERPNDQDHAGVVASRASDGWAASVDDSVFRFDDATLIVHKNLGSVDYQGDQKGGYITVTVKTTNGEFKGKCIL